jgi:two-component system, sensor histidine kinase and response regulator
MAKSRILIVDDESRNLDLLEVLLETCGADVQRASGGAEALELYAREAPNLVLLDLMMPKVNGFEVLEHLRGVRAERPVPVIVVTAGGDRDSRLRAFDLGADEFLDKPIDRAILLKRVQTLLALSSVRDALSRRNRQLEELHAQQRELTAFLVHDFKNPLSVIRHNAEWLTDELASADPDICSAVEDVATCARRLTDMVGDLLLISKLDDASEVPVSRMLCSFSQIADQVVRENSHEAEARGITLYASISGNVQGSADPMLLGRVLANLVENSLRYTPAGGRVEIAVDPNAITVSNTGRPIPEADRERVFEKFRRADRSAAYGSVGLGLHFCRRVAESHGGSIDVTSNEEWAVRFTLRIASTAQRQAC